MKINYPLSNQIWLKMKKKNEIKVESIMQIFYDTKCKLFISFTIKLIILVKIYWINSFKI